MAVGISFQKITKYLVTAVCTQPLHIGSALGDKEEVLVHPVDDVPFIQASSIAGVFRGYYAQEQRCGGKQADELFGARRLESGEDAEEYGSQVCFSDGRFSAKKPVLELRPRVRIDPVSGTCGKSVIKGTEKEAGHKFQMEYIGAGAEFEFSIYLYDEGKQEDIEGILAAIHQEQVQFGGQKSNGCGYIGLTGIRKKVFDMTSAVDRRLWAAEDGLADGEYTEILDQVRGKSVENLTNAYEIRVKGCTEGTLLVKSLAVPDCGEDAPDCENIRNAGKDYIVPGSSVKGAVRSQMERIADYLGRQEIIPDTYGYRGASQDDSRAGNIVFHDTVVGSREENDLAKLSHRIHIDKFTGGVMDGGMFHEKNISGELEFHISIKNRNHPDRTCGLLLMALRDMAVGMMNIGSGYNVGKGIIDIRSITVEDRQDGQKAEIIWKKSGDGQKQGKTEDGKGILSKCIKAVRREEEAV